MKFTDLFVKRPVLAIVVNLVILIAGLQAIRSLSVRQYPRTDIAVVKVTTAYVGANADLVRGFITSPLERVIASADGIDYIESSSAQGVSTITVHLKLNYDTNAALTQIQAKVAQVRNDLPPEAEAPIIEVETAESQFASMYIGFSSTDLDQNQITDYLTRVVQPKLSAISGVQRADILGGRSFAMRVWLKPERMAAVGISPSDVQEALSKNNYLSALGSTKGSMVSVNLVANTDLKTAEEFRQLVVKEDAGTVVRLGDIADVVLGAENYERTCGSTGGRHVHGHLVLPKAKRSIDPRVAKPCRDIRRNLQSNDGRPPYSRRVIQEASEVMRPTHTLLTSSSSSPFYRINARRNTDRRDPDSLVGAGFILLIAGSRSTADLLAIVLSVGLVVDDRSSWSRTSSGTGTRTPFGRGDDAAAAGRADHRMTITLRPH